MAVTLICYGFRTFSGVPYLSHGAILLTFILNLSTRRVPPVTWTCLYHSTVLCIQPSHIYLYRDTHFYWCQESNYATFETFALLCFLTMMLFMAFAGPGELLAEATRSLAVHVEDIRSN